MKKNQLESQHTQPTEEREIVENIPIERVIQELETTSIIISEVDRIDSLIPKKNKKDLFEAEKNPSYFTDDLFYNVLSYLARRLADVALIKSAKERARTLHPFDLIPALVYIGKIEQRMGLDVKQTFPFEELRDFLIRGEFDIAGMVSGAVDMAKFEKELGFDPQPTMKASKKLVFGNNTVFEFPQLMEIARAEAGMGLSSLTETMREFKRYFEHSRDEDVSIFRADHSGTMTIELCNLLDLSQFPEDDEFSETVRSRANYLRARVGEMVPTVADYARIDTSTGTQRCLGGRPEVTHSSIYERLVTLSTEPDFSVKADELIESSDLDVVAKALAHTEIIELLKNKSLKPEEVSFVSNQDLSNNLDIVDKDLLPTIERLKSEIS